MKMEYLHKIVQIAASGFWEFWAVVITIGILAHQLLNFAQVFLDFIIELVKTWIFYGAVVLRGWPNFLNKKFIKKKRL